MTQIRITVKVPEMVLNSSFIAEQIMRTMRSKTGPDIRNEFEKTVEGWETSPNFSQRVYRSVNSIICHVVPTGNGTANYIRVNEGSPAHVIRPRRGWALRFQTGYRAATSPRVISSRAKARFGEFISTPVVHHPGFPARKFDEVIAQDYEPTFRDDMQEAIKLGSIVR